jgi:hypothetical protein
MTSKVLLGIAVIGVLASACDSSTGSLPSNGTDGATTELPPSGTRWPNPIAGRTAESCDQIASTLSTNYMRPGTCKGVLRLDYQTMRLIGFQLYCGAAVADGFDQAEARKVAATIEGFPPPLDPATLGVSVASSSLWVLYQKTGELDGVVAFESVKDVFAATIGKAGVSGGIVAPTEWADLDIGNGCAPLDTPNQNWTGFDLVTGRSANFAQVARYVDESVFPTIMRGWHGDGRAAAILLYPRTLDPFDPSTAEYIVFLTGYSSSH